jgi:hypothetical protein
MNATLQSWARALGGEIYGDSVLCPGPGHGAEDRSLSVKLGKDGEPIVHSFAGDDWRTCRDYVREKLGLSPFKPNGVRKPAAIYEFRDPATGDVRYRKERIECADDGTKSFFFKPAGRNGSGPLLYGGERLADIAASGQPVFIVEGEKKVDRLRELGAAAVSGDSGASSKWLPAHADLLRGLPIILWPDSDEPGEKYAARAAECLRHSAASLKVVRPFGAPNGAKGRDACDWQGNAEDLTALAEGASLYAAHEGATGKGQDGEESFHGYVPPGEAPPPAGRRAKDEARQGEQKSPSRVIGAGTFMRSYTPISYTIDGVLPSGCLYGLTAKPGTGKTAGMIAATLAVETGREDILGCAVERGRVAYVTIENPVDFKMKLAVNCYFHNISFDEIEPRVAIIDGRDTPEQIYEGLRLDAEAHGDFQLVNFDTFQAGFAVANAGAFNDNEAVLKYVQRLRPLTVLPGLPSVLVAFHPTKNALEAELIPYGGGATYGEIDGNLTLWKEASIKFHWNRVRGPEFEPRFFRIEKLSSPDILDKQGRQISLPVMRPITEIDAGEREKNEGNLDLALLRAMAVNPDGTQLEWTLAIGLRSKGSISRKLQKLKTMKLIEERLTGKWRLTPKGQKEAEQ